MPSYYVPELRLDSVRIVLKDDEFHHLLHVTRHVVGDEIVLNNGVGCLAKGRIANVSKRQAEIDILEAMPFERKGPSLTVLFSPLKLKNDLITVEKLTELGVREFMPVNCARTIVKGADIEKYRRVALAAIKQCDNAYLPEIREPLPLRKGIETMLARDARVLVASEIESTSLPAFPLVDTALIIGPEGGFSDEEFHLFTEMGVTSFSLGRHVLRAETAAIAAVAAWMSAQLPVCPDYY
jgi:16S rRNA (uracil1498-N3)-methyltransferase